ncbi:MAG: phosphatase PAP2 family protein [Comamonadaceae bacterium]|nr:MAG: phosphatase PAP2 family protein [Comamonadaceae bacterium]
MDALNLQLFHWLAAGYAPNPLLLDLARLASLGASWVGIALMASALWRHAPERVYLVVLCLLAAFASMLARAVAGELDVPRPFMLGLSPPHIDHAQRGGLPSTHASVMFTVALGCLWRPRLRSVGWLLTAMALLTALARIHVGMHFPIDIAAGLLLAMVLVMPLAAAQARAGKQAAGRVGNTAASRMEAAS